MHSGGATRNVATWPMMICSVNPMTVGFPAIFQFFRIEILFSFTFPISLIIFALSFCFSSLFTYATVSTLPCAIPHGSSPLVFELLILKVCSSFSFSLFLFLHNLLINFRSFFFLRFVVVVVVRFLGF